MDKETFCTLYNLGQYGEIVSKYCIEKGKPQEEVYVFTKLITEYPQYHDILDICIDYICTEISKETPVTFVYNNQHQLIKVL